MFDLKKVIDEAQKEIADEHATKAKRALVTKLRQLETAKQVVRNIEAEIEDLKVSIGDGSFTG